MRVLFVLIVALHGAIHLMGFVKAMGLAEIQGLHGTISPREGWLWLSAAILLLAAAALFLWAPRFWWVPAVAGVVVSQVLILGAWSDARFGTLANLAILLPLLLAVADLRPTSLRSRYLTDAAEALAMTPAPPEPALLTEVELRGLPLPVQRWLRRIGVVGRPRVHSFRATFRAWIRSGPEEAWMTGPAEQYAFFHPVGRYFFMRAARWGVPAQVYHRYAAGTASMEARVAGLLPILDVRGSEMRRSETVTVLNDIFLFSPGAIPWLPLEWGESADGRVQVTFVNAGERVSAILDFDEQGDLVGFLSEDRSRFDGGDHHPVPWSTPVRSFGEFRGVRLPSEAEAWWMESGGRWSYARLAVVNVRYNVDRPPSR